MSATFALGEPVGAPTFVARGAMGELWRLDAAGGRRWAVKVLFDWVAVDPRPRDLDLQAAAAGAGITLPRPRLATDGRAVVDGVRVYEWVDLAPLLQWPIDDATLAEAGAILGTLHALALAPGPDEEVDEWYRTAPAPAHFEELADRGDAAGRTWAPVLRARIDRLAELANLVASAPSMDDDVILCHCDLTVDNVFRPAAGGPLVALDWENAGPLSAEAELAMTVSSWAPPTQWEPFLRAYEAAGGTARLRGPASFATTVATILNYLRVLVDHSLDDDGHRAFAEPKIERMLRETLDDAVPRGWMA